MSSDFDDLRAKHEVDQGIAESIELGNMRIVGQNAQGDDVFELTAKGLTKAALMFLQQLINRADADKRDFTAEEKHEALGHWLEPQLEEAQRSGKMPPLLPGMHETGFIMSYIYLPESLFSRSDLSIDQKWLYAKCVLHEPFVFDIEELAKEKNIMAAPNALARKIHVLEKHGLIDIEQEGEEWRISLGSGVAV